MRLTMRSTPSSTRVIWTQDLRVRVLSHRESQLSHSETCPKNVSTGHKEAPPSSLDNSSENATIDGAGFTAFRGKLKPGWGGECKPTTFARLGKERIRDAAAVMERNYQKEEQIFLTGTLPSVSKESLQALASWSSYVVHGLNAWIHKRCSQPDFFWVWEFQKRGALHIHYVVATHDAIALDYVLHHFKSEWCRLLESVSLKSGVDCFSGRANRNHRDNAYANVQAYAAKIKKSIGAYMSKYLTKGFCNANENGRHNSNFYPARWWRVSGSLLRQIKAATIEVTLSDLRRGKAISMFEDAKILATQQADALFSYQMQAVLGEGFVAYVTDYDTKETLWKLMKSQAENSCTRQWRREMIINSSVTRTSIFLTASDIGLLSRSLSFYSKATICGSEPMRLLSEHLSSWSGATISLSSEDACLISHALDFSESLMRKRSNFGLSMQLARMGGILRGLLSPHLFPHGSPMELKCKELLQSAGEGIDEPSTPDTQCTLSGATPTALETLWEQIPLPL